MTRIKIWGLIFLMLISPRFKTQNYDSLSVENLQKRIKILESEQNKPKEWDVSLNGWVRAEYNFDSRQSVYSREYQLNLFPLDQKLDAEGNDIHAAGASNFLAITSRLGVNFRGPDVWGAKASGKIEGDFFGNTEISSAAAGSGSIGLLRLRHATATLAWPRTSVTFGQTWYPAFIPEVSPGVANFNAGILFNPFGWAGQIRVQQKIMQRLSLIAVVYKDREFHTATASGGFANSATINSYMPTLHGQLQFKNDHFTAGVAAEYQYLKPVIQSNNLASDHNVSSMDFLAYFKYSDAHFSAKLYGITGGNLHHFVMVGGFAGYLEPNGQESYQPAKTSAAWIDLASNHENVAPGIFFGYTKNHGTENGFKYLYMRGISGSRMIDQIWRSSARVEFKKNKFNLAPELEYTAARYGDIQPNGTAGGRITDVGNFRGMLRVLYSF